MNSISVGPLSIPLVPLLLAVALIVAAAVGKRAGRTTRVENAVWLAAIIGLACARAVYVFLWWDDYRATPWKVLDIRDGGLHAAAGFAAALLVILVVAVRQRQYFPALLAAFASGSAVWIAGNAALAFLSPPVVAFPELTLAGTDGQPVKLQTFQGKPVVLNLWASWCPPCRREMPVLQSAQQRHPEVAFVFANQREAASTVDAFLFEQSLTLENVLLDTNGQLPKLLKSPALPTTLFFDANGKLVDSRVGELSRATLADRLAQITKGERKNPGGTN